MKCKPLIICFFLFFSMILLSGCDELEDLNQPQYIDVFVTCSVDVVLFPQMETMDDPQTLPAQYLEIKIEIIKAGGERMEKVVSTDNSGKTTPVSTSFKLYRDQPITCTANVIMENANKHYPEYTFNSDSKTIDWSEIYPANDFGDQVSKTVHLTVYGMHKDA